MDVEIAQDSDETQQPAGRRRRGGGVGGAKEVGKNAFWLLISFFVLAITQFGVLGLITRYGGVEEAGIWTYANAFRDPFLAFMDFGTTGLLVAEIARRRKESDELLGNGLTLGFIIGLPVMFIMMLAANLPVLDLSPLMRNAIYLTGLSSLIFTTAASFRSAFRAFNKLQYEAVISVVVMVLSIAGSFVVLYQEWNFLWLFVALAIVRLVALAVSWVLYNRNIGRLRLRFDRHIMRQLVVKTPAFTVVGLLTRAFTRIDILILQAYHGEAAAGYYGLATTLFYQLNTIAQLLTTAILPNMAEAFVKQRERIGGQLNAMIRIQIILGLPSTAIGLLLGHKIITFLYGRGYEDTVLIFQLLVSVVVLRFINQTLGIVLTAMDQQGRRASMLTVTVIFNIALNFVLIPRFSYIGATITAALSEVVLFITTYLVIDRDVRRAIRWSNLFRPLLSTLAVVPLLYLIRDWPLALTLPLSVVLVLISLSLFRTLAPEEAKLIARLINSIGPLPKNVKRLIANFILRYARVDVTVRDLEEAAASPTGDDHEPTT